MNRVAELLTDLATCLCHQITEDGSPETCFCGVIPGDMAVAEYMGECSTKCGMAWVRMTAMYPAAGVGIADESVSNCAASIGFDVELGIMRCVAVSDARGNPPSPEAQLESVVQQSEDAMTVWRAVNCCPSLNSKDFKLGSYAPLGPMGGYVGGVWTLSVVI